VPIRGQQQGPDREERESGAQGGQPMLQRPAQNGRVRPADAGDDEGFGRLHAPRQQQRGQHRRHRERSQQRARQRVRVGARHRAEDLAFDSLHREQRDEGRHRDRRREQHRAVDLQCAHEDRAQPIGPGAPGLGRQLRVVPALRELGQQRRPLLARPLQVVEQVFNQDHRRVDDDAEIDRADRQPIGRLAREHQHDHAEQQRERDAGADDQRAAQIAEEDPWIRNTSRQPSTRLRSHRARGHVDQRRPVVKRRDLHAGRQRAVVVDPLDLALTRASTSLVCKVRFITTIAVTTSSWSSRPGLAQPRQMADPDRCDVLHAHRRGMGLRQHDVADIGRVANQADAADVDRLLAQVERTAADVDVGVAPVRRSAEAA